MKILGLEFSSTKRSVAALDTGGGSGNGRAAQRVESGPGGIHAARMIDETLRQVSIERVAIDCVAIGIGPGSYTGIRAALAFAQGWTIAAPHVRLAPVPSSDCIAEQFRLNGRRGRVAVVIDAQRGELYSGIYDLAQERIREVEPLRLCSPNDIVAAQQAGLAVIGPEATKWFPEGSIVFPEASTLCALAVARNHFVPGERIEPIYLRETTFVKAAPPRAIGL